MDRWDVDAVTTAGLRAPTVDDAGSPTPRRPVIGGLRDVSGRHPRVAALATATLAAVAVRGAVFGDERAWAYVVVLAALTMLVGVVGAFDRLSRSTLWALAGLGVAHALGGLAPAPGAVGVSFYEYWLVEDVVKVDQVVHAAGSAIITVAFAELLTRWLDPSRTTLRLRWGLAGLLACGVGALNEVFEYLLSLRFDQLRIGDATNTGWDLVFNLAGVVAVGVAACVAGPSDDAPERDRPVRDAWS